MWMGKSAFLFAAACAALLAALVAAPAAFADSSGPLRPLSTSTTDLIVTGIVVACVVVVSWLVLYRLAEGRRASNRAQRPSDEDAH
jgi:membrane protein implicated in regulation of membrane protease activity